MEMYQVVIKSINDDSFKEYVTREAVNKQEATLIKTILRSQIDDDCYIEFEKV